MAGDKPSHLCSASVWSENSLQSDEHPEIFGVTLLLNAMNYSTIKIVIRTKFFLVCPSKVGSSFGFKVAG